MILKTIKLPKKYPQPYDKPDATDEAKLTEFFCMICKTSYIYWLPAYHDIEAGDEYFCGYCGFSFNTHNLNPEKDRNLHKNLDNHYLKALRSLKS